MPPLLRPAPHVPGCCSTSYSSSTSSSSLGGLRGQQHHHHQHHRQPLPQQQRAAAGAATRARAGADRPGSSSNGGRPGGGGGGGGRPERKARKPGLFEVAVVSPPPRSLGVYALPPHTHNGEQIEIDGQGYVVTSLVLQFRLVKGRYVRDHSKLEVRPTGRFFAEMMLEGLVRARYHGPTGPQD